MALAHLSLLPSSREFLLIEVDAVVPQLYEGDIAIPGITGLDAFDSEGGNTVQGRQVRPLPLYRVTVCLVS